MSDRDRKTFAWVARQKVRKLRADEALAELERAQKVLIESRKRVADEDLAEIGLGAKK
jgi:hypothetical protein